MTATPLLNPECKAQKQHLIEWAGVGVCCVPDQRLRDLLPPPRPATEERT